jgi:hypothetical protein
MWEKLAIGLMALLTMVGLIWLASPPESTFPPSLWP